MIFSGIDDPTKPRRRRSLQGLICYAVILLTVSQLVGALSGIADANESRLKHHSRNAKLAEKFEEEIQLTKSSVKTMYAPFYVTNGSKSMLKNFYLF